MAKTRFDLGIPSPSRRAALKTLTALLAIGGMQRLAAEPTTIRINIPGPLLMPFFPVELIPRIGIDNQLDCHLGIRYHPSGVFALEDMLAGNADFAGVGFPVLPKFLAQGKSVVAIARLSSGAPPYAIVVRADLADSIRSITDLRGRTLGVPAGSATTKTYLQLIAEQWMSAYGVTPDQLRWAPIAQTYEGVYGALAADAVDAVFCEEPNSGGLVRAGIGQTLASLNDPRNPVRIVGKNHLRAVVVTTPQRIQADPQRVQMMVNMLRRSLSWTRTATPAAILDQLQVSDAGQRADLLDALTRLAPLYSGDGAFPEDEIQATRDFMKAVDIKLPGNADVRSLIDDRWIRAD